MKVLFVLRDTKNVGGLEKIVSHALVSLEEFSIEFRVAILGPDEVGSSVRRLFDPIAPVVYAYRSTELIESIKWADVVHVHAPTLTYWSPGLLTIARLFRKGRILTVHLPSEPRPRRRWVGRMAASAREMSMALVLRLTGTYCYAPSAAAAACASLRWRGMVRVDGLVQGIPDPGWTPLPEENLLRVVMVGRLAQQKSPITLVEAVALANRAGAAVSADVVGDGPLREQVKSRARELGLGPNEVRLHGYIDDPLPLMRAASLLVLTSSAEGCPVVVMEAAALGRPSLVRSGLEGVEEILPGSHLEVPDNADAADFMEALLRAASNREALRAVGQQARRQYENLFSLEAAALRYEAAYRRSQPAPR